MSLESVHYGNFLKKQRELRNIGREVLGEGIYRDNTMGRIERGERYPNKLTRDRLLERLGESCYDYEHYLTPEEYAEWEIRRNILDALDNGDLEIAEKLLVQFEQEQDMTDRVVRQFLLTMRVQWMELCGVPEEQCLQTLEEAVKLTVPVMNIEQISHPVLAIQELNLMLEYSFHKETVNAEQFYSNLLQIVEQGYFDSLSKAMFGAKISLFYCRYRNKNTKLQGLLEQWEWTQKSLEICSKGIEWLRNRNKCYYALELLEIKEQYLRWLLEHKALVSENTWVVYEEELKQTQEFYTLLDGLYEEYKVLKKTNSYTCFYREYEVYCINDVIQARRSMFGVSIETLEDELVCSKSTMKRLEAGKNIQRANAQRLFERFHLSMEQTRAQLVTENQEVIRWEEEYRRAYDQRDFQKAVIILNKIKKLLDLKDLINRQYIDYSELSLRYCENEISKEYFIQTAKKILEYTVPYEVAIAEIKDVRLPNGRIRKVEKYLTNQEMTILYNIILLYGTSKENSLWNIMEEYFERLEKRCTLSPIIGMYGLVMSTVASYKGNMMQFKKSCEINRKIVLELLRTRNMSYLHGNMYDLLWNDRKQKGLPMVIEDPEWRNGLLRCLLVDNFCKDDWRASKIRKRLDL
ncbi:MAG: hypothetical protein J6C07_05935 [Lachnospiraceae bacterium]|nr:hypothetical protein [Lachnospiraceae bacterium]